MLNGVTEGIIAGRDWKELVGLIDSDCGSRTRNRELGESLFNRNWPLIYQNISN